MSTDKISNTIQLIKNDKSLENHFFKKLAVANNPLEWLIPLKDAGCFNPANNPRPEETPQNKGYYYIPHWNILDALENMAIKNEENPDDEISKILLEITDRIIKYREDREKIDNYRTDWVILKIISHFPIKYINEEHIQFIKDSLHPKIGTSLLEHEIGKSLLPMLIRERAKDLIIKLLDVILHYKKSENKYVDKYISVIDSYYLKETLDNNKKGVSEICAIEAAKVAINKIQEILKEDKSEFNFVWIPTIENHEQKRFPDRYENQLVDFVRDMLEAEAPEKIKPIVEFMLCEEHDIFKRLAYHLINIHYDVLSQLLWNLNYNPLDALTMHELFELFKAHCKEYDNSQIRKILNWIETQDLHPSDEIKNDPNKKIAYEVYYRKEWLIALLDSDNKEVRSRYEEYHAINDATYEHPGFHYWSSGAGWIKEVSPIEEDEFNKMTNAEIKEYINSYKEKKDISWRDHTQENLASSFRKFVSNNPVKYSSDLTPFLSVPRKYQYELLGGLEEAWRNHRNFDWNELLPFIKELIEDVDYWSDGNEKSNNNYASWISNTIADILGEGMRDDKHAFAPSLLPIAEHIILILLKNIKSDLTKMIDLVTSVLNSSKGKVFIAAIQYSLRYARLYCKDKDSRWIESIKSEFEIRLDKKREPDLEFSIVVGEYLPYIKYLDNQWVVTNINKIFDLESNKHWEAAFTGYILTTSTIYEDIYKLLRDNGHYERGLLYTFEDKEVAKKLVQNITIGYFAGWDDLANADGLMSKLLKTENTEYLSEIVSFAWIFRDKEDEEFKKKIKPLWEAIIEKVTQNLEKDTYKSIASNLARWLSLINIIDDDIYEWLKISARFIETNWNSSFFIEYLLKHVRKTPEKVGNLYLTMLNAGNYPYYKKEDIIAIVQTLYDSKQEEIANRICNIYFDSGFDELLRETFKKYNESLPHIIHR